MLREDSVEEGAKYEGLRWVSGIVVPEFSHCDPENIASDLLSINPRGHLPDANFDEGIIEPTSWLQPFKVGDSDRDRTQGVFIWIM